MNRVTLDAEPPIVPLFRVDEHTLVFAFRYALGRQSTAPSHVVAQLKAHWSQFNQWTRFQIHREISQAIAHGEAGRDCDIATWREIIALPAASDSPAFVSEAARRIDAQICPGCQMVQHNCLCSHDEDDGCFGPGGGNSHS